MALVTRTISNTGSPLTDVNGALLADTIIRFTLVNDRSYAAGTFDVETGEPVAPGPYLATTDNNGIFSVDLWPTSRGLEQRFYLCEIAPESDTVDFPAFKAPLVADDYPLPFLSFRISGDTVPPWEMDAFTAHTQDMALHTAGVGIASLGIDSNGHLIVTLEDSTVIDAGELPAGAGGGTGDRNIDGGAPDSVYLPAQKYDGGGP